MVTLLMIIITMAIDFLINGRQSQADLIQPVVDDRQPLLVQAPAIGQSRAGRGVGGDRRHPRLRADAQAWWNSLPCRPAASAPDAWPCLLPIIALVVGMADAWIADRVTPVASIQTIEIQDRLLNQNRTGRVWEVPSTRTSWFVGSEQLLTGTVPSMHIIVIASARGLVMADSMIYVSGRVAAQRAPLIDFRVHSDGTAALDRPSHIDLTGDLILPFDPHQLFARLLPRDTMTGTQLMHSNDRSDIA